MTEPKNPATEPATETGERLNVGPLTIYRFSRGYFAFEQEHLTFTGDRMDLLDWAAPRLSTADFRTLTAFVKTPVPEEPQP